MDRIIRKISQKETSYFYSKYHYIGKSLVCPVHYGEIEDNKLTACASFGFLPSPLIPKTVWINGNNDNTLELRRLSSISNRPNAESSFISGCFRLLKLDYPKIKLIFSYADMKAGHHGYIYQATNFYYVGVRSGKTLYYLDNKNNKIHNRTVNRWLSNKNDNINNVNLNNKFIDTFNKHLYVYIIPKGKEKKSILSEFTVETLPYPKGDNKMYKYNLNPDDNQTKLF